MSLYRYAIGVSYFGHSYFGFQAQKHSDNTVANALSQAFTRVCNDPEIDIVAAGRTDSGVHATGQVIHLDTLNHRHEDAILRGGNRYLPADIRLLWVKQMQVFTDTTTTTAQPDLAGLHGQARLAADTGIFHARYSALSRTYHYVIADNSLGEAILANRVTVINKALDEHAMQTAANCLLGEHDFSAFRAAHCQSKSPYRYLESLYVKRRGRFVVIEVKANAFLYHMVRNITGALIHIGLRRAPADQMVTWLLEKNRNKLPATAPAAGLYLTDVCYAPYFALPHAAPPAFFTS